MEGIFDLLKLVLLSSVSVFVGGFLVAFVRRKKKPEVTEASPVAVSRGNHEKDDYFYDKEDSGLFISPVDDRLKVRITKHKNPDMQTVSSSRPHRFFTWQVNNLKDNILEIFRLNHNDYSLELSKSPAADFSDFQDEIMRAMFNQLHDVYAYGSFPQRVWVDYIVKKDYPMEKRLWLKFLDVIVIENGPMSVITSKLCKLPELSGCRPNSDNELIIAKADDHSWSDFNKVIIAKLNELFPAGVDYEGQWPEDEPESENIVKIISQGESLVIEESDGETRISDAKDVFKYISSAFKEVGLNQPGPATAGTLVDVGEIVKDATLVQVFADISPDLDALVLTPAQIVKFCKKHPGWLRHDQYATFFLTKVLENYLVVSVRVVSDGLSVSVRLLDDERVWEGKVRHRMVFPRLAA